MITNYRSPAIYITVKASTLLCLSSRNKNGVRVDRFHYLILVKVLIEKISEFTDYSYYNKGYLENDYFIKLKYVNY